MRVLFLDFDGVVRVPLDEVQSVESIDFCKERIEMLANFCRTWGVKVVVSSDWRNMGNRTDIENHLGARLSACLHEDWGTRICGHRHNEIGRWLYEHGDVVEYVVLDDFRPHFDGASEAMLDRLVLCNNRFGLQYGHMVQMTRCLKLF